MLNNIVDNYEQCGQHNIVAFCFQQPRTSDNFWLCISFLSFSLYGTPLDPTIFDVSMETMGLFATSKLSDDLLNPKNIGKHSQDVDEIDLMDYIIAKNSTRTLGTSSKMEQLLSSMYGILEVEPLDFSCSSMSDGCKIDYCQGSGPQGGGGNGIGSLYYPNTGADPSAPMSSLQDHVQQLKVSVGLFGGGGGSPREKGVMSLYYSNTVAHISCTTTESERRIVEGVSPMDGKGNVVLPSTGCEIPTPVSAPNGGAH